MKDKYEVVFWQDDEYVVYETAEEYRIGYDYIFKGTLPEVDAWIRLKEKGLL